jgi:endonuclease/exonuclease/phosphatase family metal-dependent hydrolase
MIVAQWNTHHSGVGSDGKLNPEHIADTLAMLNADVVCLQEVERFTGYGNFDPLDKWCKLLGANWSGYFCTLTGHLDGKGPGIIIMSRLPMELPQAKGLVAGRAILTANIGGRLIACTHLDNVSASTRNIEGTQINCWPVVNQASPAILCGDWNAQTNTVELAPFGAWYRDAWAEGVKTGLATSFNGTGNTRNTRIDIVYYRGLTLKHVNVPDTRINGVFPSDHHPVVVEFA